MARPHKVAADDLGVRSKIRDLGWHRLRANVAALTDWLRICHREGWLAWASEHRPRGARDRPRICVGMNESDRHAFN